VDLTEDHEKDQDLIQVIETIKDKDLDQIEDHAVVQEVPVVIHEANPGLHRNLVSRNPKITKIKKILKTVKTQKIIKKPRIIKILKIKILKY
jgi:hypothetical protein